MALIVMKFGGTSVGSVEKIKNVAQIVSNVKNEGNDVVVAVSAMAGETDKLVGLVSEIAPTANPREYDQVVATGEQVTIGLLALALQQIGIDAISYCGWQMGMITDSAHSKARIEEIRAERVHASLKEGKVVVVAGFQGITQDTQDVATLGRGGSDTTAVAVAVGLKADRCDIYTDVDGVYTTDPRIVPEARRLPVVSYDEMLEMASMGAKVLQTRSVEFAKKYNMPVRVRSTFKLDDEGTLVTSEEDTNMEKVMISGIAYNKNEAKITLTRINDKPGLASTIFSAIAQKNVNVDVIIQNISPRGDGQTDLSFTVPKNEVHKALEALESLKSSQQIGDILVDEKVAKVSIIGAGMQSHAGVAAKMFTALANEGINIMMISTSEIKISCVIAEKYTELAVRALHEAFELEKE
ncbi:aspartate kinase [Desulfurispirillum indicum]|uniref:Aspartokinase n=1 Tax=Desulfurispirillum indicum (strain ATCC BAA-1389 / DSM 22839 / S5) TaxID=653733 RepID=E6W299_DESIS|nr:aspartate kinase [Desulfurispirillum indicum]ADU65557.1 aspartate kinase [Desulfurispirillum indicum S5]UCZ57611.1 aspartate kinase [Desulfurispirillum indicum]